MAKILKKYLTTLMPSHSAGKKTVEWKFFPWNQFRVCFLRKKWFHKSFGKNCERELFSMVLLNCFSLKGLVYFQGIRATWHKKFSVTATVKPSIPPNRVFSGSTFDFRWPTHILYLEGDFGNFLRNDPIMLQSQNLKPSFLLYKSSNI